VVGSTFLNKKNIKLFFLSEIYISLFFLDELLHSAPSAVGEPGKARVRDGEICQETKKDLL
jgi:hypothetical protein